jgi:hypothetical protein
MNTSFVPAEKLTLFPLLDDDNTVSRDNVEPDEVYVPTPFSHSDPITME